MGEETFFGYQDIGEKGFIEWSLGYTMDPIIECFLGIPEDRRYERVLEKLNAPCCFFGASPQKATEIKTPANKEIDTAFPKRR